MKVGGKIRFFRKKQKLTQKELAYKAGLAEITIRQYERGLYEPKLDTAKKIAAALEISVNELLNVEEKGVTRMTIKDIRTSRKMNSKPSIYDNMLCRNCRFCKSVSVGYVSSRSWCSRPKGNGYEGKALGVQPWRNTIHPECPMRKQINEKRGKQNEKV